MPRSKKGKEPKKKSKTLHEIDSGKKSAEATEEKKKKTAAILYYIPQIFFFFKCSQ